jgi:putative ABC transport system permease protein
MAIRSAIGVGGVRLVRQLLTESALLATAGGFGGIALAVWATRSLTLLTKDPRLLDAQIDTSVLLFAVVVTVATTILFGLAPAVRTVRVDASKALGSGSRGGSSRENSWVQRGLVVGEVALCVILLAGAGLLVKSFHRVLDVQPGFRTENLVILRAGLPSRYNTVHAVLGLYAAIDNRLGTLPGVSGATLASRLPITGNEARGDINIEGRPAASGELGTSTFRGILPNYTKVMGIPLILGRVFDQRDDIEHTPVVMISDSFQRNFWPNESPIGKRIKIGPANAGQWSTIVGVVGDVRQVGLDSEAPYSIYEPLATRPATHFDIAVRTQGDPQSVMASAPRELRKVEPGLVIERVTTMVQRINDSVAPRRLTMTLFALFAALSLTLAAVGLYGVVAYAAEQRIREFGVRMALGAQPIDVLGLVLGQGLRMALLGVVIGLATTAGVGRVLKKLLFGVEPTDPWTLVGVAALLIVTSLVACWMPARRAIRIDPVDALRGE